jgi:nucleotide-binding universal stress UspA family protein
LVRIPPVLIVVNDSGVALCRLLGETSQIWCEQDSARARRGAMIKDVIVPVDGTAADEARLAAANHIAEVFDSQIIGLFLNVLPLVIVPEDGIGAAQAAQLLQKARGAADRMEARLTERLARLQRPMHLRRFDILQDAVGEVAAREARTADAFVALRPNGVRGEPEHLVEGVLFGSGRHIFLVPGRKPAKLAFDNVLVAWNGSREAARALAEARPYLHKAKAARVVVVDDKAPAERQAVLGKDAVDHLKHHHIKATLHHARLQDHDVGKTLIAEARRLQADLIVMGGYGHSRLREWLLGGATYELLHKAPVPLLLAH